MKGPCLLARSEFFYLQAQHRGNMVLQERTTFLVFPTVLKKRFRHGVLLVCETLLGALGMLSYSSQ